MTFPEQIRYNKMFHQVVYKGGDSETNYNKQFHIDKAMEISVGNSSTEDQLMHNFVKKFQQFGK